MFFSSLMHCHAPRNLSEWLSNLSPTNKKPFGALRFHPMHPGSRWRERSWRHIYREGRRLECALLQRLIGLPSFLLGTPDGLSWCWASLRADMALPRPNKLAYFLRRLFPGVPVSLLGCPGHFHPWPLAVPALSPGKGKAICLSCPRSLVLYWLSCGTVTKAQMNS